MLTSKKGPRRYYVTYFWSPFPPLSSDFSLEASSFSLVLENDIISGRPCSLIDCLLFVQSPCPAAKVVHLQTWSFLVLFAFMNISKGSREHVSRHTTEINRDWEEPMQWSEKPSWQTKVNWVMADLSCPSRMDKNIALLCLRNSAYRVVPVSPSINNISTYDWEETSNY